MSNAQYSQSQPHKKSVNERLLNNDNNTNKARKFRWSSCFSFITKFKKSKSTNDKKVRLSQSYQEFEQPKELELTKTSVSEYIEVEPEKSQWKPQQIPPPSLSPPPRQTKSKRESMNPQQQQQQQQQNEKQNVETKDTRNRRPLLDPTLTPRVKPRSIKTKKQPSLLRLSLDAELLQSTDKEDNDSLIRTGHSSVSLTPTSTILPQAPFRSGTLGATNNSRISAPLPPLPHHIPHDRPISTTQSFIDSTSSRTSSQVMSDSPISVSAIKLDDEEDKLTLKERRRRRSPLSIPNSDQLTLALMDGEPITKNSDIMKRQTYDLHNIYMNHIVDDIVEDWRQQSVEEDTSRQEAMLILEGKKKSSSIMPMEELDRLFEKSNDERTTRTTKKSYEEKKNNKLDMITENKIAANYSSRVLPQVDATPETPPYHKQTAPSLISSPSTPNSIDSSVLEHDDYLHHGSLLATSE